MTNDGRREFSAEIDAPPDKVWRAITDPAKTRQYYYGTDILSNWQPGSRWTSEEDGHLYLEGKIVEIEPERKLVQTFRVVDEEPASGDPPSQVSWQLTPTTSGTRVDLVHSGQGDATLAYTEGGWEYILAGLKSVAESD